MTGLEQKNILLGITGGIAAYKSAELVRRLVDAGAAVRVVMTEAATQFISPITLQALSGEPVRTQLFDTDAEAAMSHIELARWADVIVVAPASADCIARFTHGYASDLLSTVVLASTAQLIIAPAMNQQMWLADITQHNVQQLIMRDVRFVAPDVGPQVCGDNGPGRLAALEDILATIHDSCLPQICDGMRFLITAGPTQEALDPVRYFSNPSSGKMGFALARAAKALGATVCLVSGPVGLPDPKGVEVLRIQSAQQMYETVLSVLDGVDVFIGAAAVADFYCARPAPQKVEKITYDECLTLHMVRTPDIISAVTRQDPKPYCVGFAAQTENLLEKAKDKLNRKNLDMIIANDVSAPGIGFGSDDNAVTVITKTRFEEFPRSSKQHLAYDLLSIILAEQHERSTSFEWVGEEIA